MGGGGRPFFKPWSPGGGGGGCLGGFLKKGDPPGGGGGWVLPSARKTFFLDAAGAENFFE